MFKFLQIPVFECVGPKVQAGVRRLCAEKHWNFLIFLVRFCIKAKMNKAISVELA